METETRTAYDRHTGKRLTPADAQAAADNPTIWTWVDWRPAPA